jgi:hypothetical protein
MSLINNKLGNTPFKRMSFSKTVCWLFLSLSIVILLYVFYRAEIVYQGLSNSRYFIFYVISIVSIVFWAFVIRLKNKHRLNIIIVTTSIVFTLYLAEFSTIIFPGIIDRNNVRLQAAKELGIDFDKRSRIEIYKEMKSKGQDPAVTIIPSDFIGIGQLEANENILPLSGVANRNTIHCNEGGITSIFKSDRYGFNNPDEEWNSSDIKWLLTGDSFVLGACVEQGNDFAGQLRDLSGDSAINLGGDGFGPLFELATLKEYGASIKPEIVLWFYFDENDLVNLDKEKTSQILVNYLKTNFNQNLMNRQDEIDQKVSQFTKKEYQRQNFIELSKNLRLYNLRALLKFDYNDRNSLGSDENSIFLDESFEQHDTVLFEEILLAADRHVSRLGAELYFVYLPSYFRYKWSHNRHDEFNQYSEVLSIIDKLNIPIIDVHKTVFKNHKDPLSLFPLRLNGHYNSEGYKEIAKTIIAEVESRNN